MSRILVTGGASGLGAAIVAQLLKEGHDVFIYDNVHGDDVLEPAFDETHGIYDGLDVLVNCAGVNIIGWLDDFQEWEWDTVMDVNAKGIFKMTQYLHPRLKASRGTVLNIVSNAAHMPMRCSAAYNASKGAALMLTKQLARELIADGITVFSVSPNKLAGTGMSNSIDEQVMRTRGWTREEAQEYQLKGLLTGKETSVERCAEFIAFLLADKGRHEMLAGCDLQYGL